jgi:hypothetical protein
MLVQLVMRLAIVAIHNRFVRVDQSVNAATGPLYIDLLTMQI